MKESNHSSLLGKIAGLNILLGIQFCVYLIFRGILENNLTWEAGIYYWL